MGRQLDLEPTAKICVATTLNATYLLGRVWAAALVGGGVVVASVGYSVWSVRAGPGTAFSGNIFGWKDWV